MVGYIKGVLEGVLRRFLANGAQFELSASWRMRVH